MAIEAQQFTEKDELIAKFYTLRAGLSAIAEETKEIKSVENELNDYLRKDKENQIEIKEKYEEKNSQNRSKKSKLENKLEACEYLCNREKRALSDAKSKLDELNRPMAYMKFKKEYSLVIFITTAIISIVTFEILFYSLIQFTFPSFVQKNDYIGMHFVLWGVNMIIVSFVYNIIRNQNAKKICKKEISNCEAIISSIKREISRYSENAKKYNDEIDSLFNEYENQLGISIYGNEICQLNSKLQTKIIPLHTARAKAIKAALNKEFDLLLTEADWQNVDLLIFYLNTGRADSLKEALLLVDKQRQTDQIAHAISAASQHIANTIHDSTYRLATVMTRCTSQLSNQINNNHMAMMSELQRNTNAIENLNQNIGNIGAHIDSLNRNINSLGSSIGEQTAAIISAEQLNASLLTQANQSCDKLIQELRYNQRYWVK